MGIVKQINKTSLVTSNRIVRSRSNFAASSMMSVRSNVMSSTRSGSNPGNSIVKIPQRTITSWLGISDELRTYELFSLIQNIMKLITDYVYLQIDFETDQFFTIDNDEKLTIKYNSFIRNLNIMSRLRGDIWDIIYFGNKSYALKKLTKGSQTTFEFIDLIESNKILVKIEKPIEGNSNLNMGRKSGKVGEIISRYVVFADGAEVEVPVEDIISFGKFDFKLVDDYTANRNSSLVDRSAVFQGVSNPLTVNGKGEELNVSLLYESSAYYATKSIFYSLTNKIKDYLVKDVLATILSIKDVLTPILLRLGVDLTRASDTAELSKTVNELESKINDVIDESIVASGQLSLDEIIKGVLSTTRLIPDPGNLLSNMDEINMAPIKDKLNQIKEERQNSKDSVMDDLGIPADLFDGGSNQYEVLTRSQRYETTISTILTNLKSIFITNILKLAKLSGNFSTDELKLLVGAKCNVFKVSTIDITKRSQQIEQQQTLAQSLQSLIETYTSLIKDNPIVIKEKALSKLRLGLAQIDPEYSEMISDTVPDIQVEY